MSAGFEQLEIVFRDAADPIIIEDLDGIVIDLNSAAERLYGWPRDELVGRPIKTIVPDSRHDQADEILAQCKAGQEVRNIEGLRMTRSGTILPVLITLSLMKDENGLPTSIASFAKEITAQKQAEAELRQLADQLEVRVKQRTAEIEQTNKRLSHELAVARELNNAANREHEAMLLGESIAVRSLRESIESYGHLDEPLLLVGPRGAGDEAVARSLHLVSSRADRPFIYFDVSASSASGDGLFDTWRDSSGEQLPGKASLADGGTLYLQGIDQLSAAGQESLLEFLRGTQQTTDDGNDHPDIRLIAYTSKDLMDESLQRRMDAKLVQEISRLKLAIPSLAERRDDILPIAERITLIRARSMGKVLNGISDQAIEMLQNYNWPGNIDELQSVIDRAVVLAEGEQLDIPSELLHEGPKLGSYRLVRHLGSGAMGEVWLANHALLARPAAVKLIRQQAMDGDSEKAKTQRARFQREAQATAQLRSPHTVELYDFGVSEDGSFYYVMEFLDGIDFQKLVNDFGTVQPARAVYLIRQACLSLAEAHDAGLVHRDIKPSNLFTCRLGMQFDFAKVLDFGIVRLTKGKDPMVTATGASPGTPAYMAPELVLEAAQAQPAADIYGLGCVAYWLLTGRPVFDAPNSVALLMKHAGETPDPPSLYQHSIPESLDAIVLDCLAKNPKDRPKDAMELREQLSQTSLDDHWNENQARTWWSKHMTDDPTGTPVSEEDLDHTTMMPGGNSD